MITGRARVMREQNPARVRVHDNLGRVRWHDAWLGNPHMIGKGEVASEFQTIVDTPGNRPYHTRKTTSRWYYDFKFRAVAGNLYFSDAERLFAAAYDPEIVIVPTVKKKASPNKQWGANRWKEFARLAATEGYRLAQLGPAGTVPIEGAELIQTDGFRVACSILARAKAYVGHEGGLHHAAAALGIPGVVIFGGFTPVELTGYSLHRNLGASLGEACGWRVPCTHCEATMASITPENVLTELKAVLNER